VLQQLSLNARAARRQVAAFFGDRVDAQPVNDTADDPVLARQAEIGSLRGVTPAAADVSECACPEPCERDHANE
jgi:hypothetical protein